jgi:hypothetical protein
METVPTGCYSLKITFSKLKALKNPGFFYSKTPVFNFATAV